MSCARRNLTLCATVLLATLATLPSDRASADCTCRLPGETVPLGTVACLSPGGRPGLYECAMNLNITSWRRVADGCPSAALDQAGGASVVVAFSRPHAPAAPH
jgi:hypothetical protein